MARDDPGFRVDGFDHSIGAGHHALNVSSGRVIDERIHAVEEKVTRVIHVGIREMHGGVAVGVGWRQILVRDFFAVMGDLAGVGEGGLGTPLGREGWRLHFHERVFLRRTQAF